jgi:hypothetical protein
MKKKKGLSQNQISNKKEKNEKYALEKKAFDFFSNAILFRGRFLIFRRAGSFVLKFDFDLCFTFFLFPRKIPSIPQKPKKLLFCSQFVFNCGRMM